MTPRQRTQKKRQQVRQERVSQRAREVAKALTTLERRAVDAGVWAANALRNGAVTVTLVVKGAGGEVAHPQPPHLR